ncbi:hypothetical protein IU501_26935 [Nocardia otitidiscaviarum]|uniref:hypothetical protein n=1 Tax=Nocardia otitidiscaviarum TaxID=1823 RepID=UPI0004A77EA0|nr:hypothetical protein [Nocardia otitidiscaviarum]MBF6136622.1 hypothetical protein [Nocardia otitidiscaviarum]MBF6484824.1 hypothetical protein [Nocardia otitidiscaviarum]
MTVHRADAILGLVIDIIDDSHGPFTAREITRATRPLIDPPPTLDEVAAVLDMLAHPDIAGISARSDGTFERVPGVGITELLWQALDDDSEDEDSYVFLAEVDDRY